MTLAIALLIGLAFGALLQRSGLARPDTMLGALRWRDLTLVKLMGLAIGVAAIGIAILSSLGLAHLSIKPLYLLGVGAGGLLFGTGIAVSGYCPGTILVASTEGRRDAWFALLGALTGALAYVVAYPLLEPRLVAPFSFGRLTLGELAGVGGGVAGLVVGVSFIAISFALPLRPGARRTRVPSAVAARAAVAAGSIEPDPSRSGR